MKEMMIHQSHSTPWYLKIEFLVMILMTLSEISLNDRIKLNQDSMCIAGNPSNCPNSDEDECEYQCQSLKSSYLYSGQVEGAFGLSDTSIDAGNINANNSGFNCYHDFCVEDELLSNCDHKSCVEDELLSNCDHKSCIEDELLSNCDTKVKVEDKSVRLSGKNSISLDFANPDPMC